MCQCRSLHSLTCDPKLGSQYNWYSGGKSTEVGCPQINMKPLTKLKWPVVIIQPFSHSLNIFKVFNHVLVPCEGLNSFLPQGAFSPVGEGNPQ